MEGFGKLMAVVLAAASIFGGGFFGCSVHFKGREVDLRNSLMAKQKTNEASFDTMFRILKDKAGIATKDREDFKALWPDLIGKRYENDKTVLMKWIQERNPQWDSSLFKDLMVSVEAERKRFLRDQEELARLKKEHDNVIDGPISGFFVSGKSKVEITIVTGKDAQEAFQTGTDHTDPLEGLRPPAPKK